MYSMEVQLHNLLIFWKPLRFARKSRKKSLKYCFVCGRMALNAMKKKSNPKIHGQRGRAIGCKRACAKLGRSSLWSGKAETAVGFDGAAPLQAYEGVLAPKLGGTASCSGSPHVLCMGRVFFCICPVRTGNQFTKGISNYEHQRKHFRAASEV